MGSVPITLLRSRARELKFFLSPDIAACVRTWALQAMSADPHLEAGQQDLYTVNTLYFDTIRRDVFHKQGSYARSKYRIRCYGQEQTAFLERKIKTGGQISKWRLPIPISDLSKVSYPGSDHDDWSGAWFRRRIQLRKLEPVCRISYYRMARESRSRFGRFRLTLDEAIYAEPIQILSFARDNSPLTPVDCCPHGMVLELKFTETMPALFKELIEYFRLTESSFSKYRGAVNNLGLAPELNSSSCLTF